MPPSHLTLSRKRRESSHSHAIKLCSGGIGPAFRDFQKAGKHKFSQCPARYSSLMLSLGRRLRLSFLQPLLLLGMPLHHLLRLLLMPLLHLLLPAFIRILSCELLMLFFLLLLQLLPIFLLLREQLVLLLLIFVVLLGVSRVWSTRTLHWRQLTGMHCSSAR